jgi:hypothetical protein
MLTYIKHQIRKITEEDRWLEVLNRLTGYVMFASAFYMAFNLGVKVYNYIPEEGPKYPPPCQGKRMGNRLLVNHKTCCSLFNCNNCECMTYEEFWEVFDICKLKETLNSWLPPFGLSIPPLPTYTLWYQG